MSATPLWQWLPPQRRNTLFDSRLAPVLPPAACLPAWQMSGWLDHPSVSVAVMGILINTSGAREKRGGGGLLRVLHAFPVHSSTPALLILRALARPLTRAPRAHPTPDAR